MGGAQYNCGVIHNQSQMDIAYLLLTEKLSGDGVAALTKLTTEEMKQLIMPTGGNHGLDQSLVKELRSKVKNIESLKKEMFSISGLKNLDFKKEKYLAILVKGKEILMKQVSKYGDVCLQIQPKLTVSKLNQKDANYLETAFKAITKQAGKCPSCPQKGSKNKEFEQKEQCCNCHKKFNDLWVCSVVPKKHTYCDQCNELLEMQAKINQKYKEDNKKSVKS